MGLTNPGRKGREKGVQSLENALDHHAYFKAEWDEHEAVASATRAALGADIARALTLWADAIRAGNKLLFFGNGGSAGDAQHLATELAVRYVKDRAPIAAIALTTDTSSLTAIGNDMGFGALFERQINAIGRPGDVAIGISTSGRSENVIRGLRAARAAGLHTMGFAGRDGGDMVGLADPLLIVPSNTTARIQEMHITIGQMLCGALERDLGLV